MEKKPNPVKTKFIDNDNSIVTIDLTRVKEREPSSNNFSFILQRLPSPSSEGYSFRVIYDVKGFLKAG